MEDISVLALTVGGVSEAELADRIYVIEDGVARIHALTKEVLSLIESRSSAISEIVRLWPVANGNSDSVRPFRALASIRVPADLLKKHSVGAVART